MGSILSEAARCAIRVGRTAHRSSTPAAGRRAAWVLATALGLAACPAWAELGDLMATYRNPAPSAGDNFGTCITAMGNNVLVGAYRDTVGGSWDAGSVYLLNGDTGALIRAFPDPPPASDDLFGRSVAVVGNNILVGADCDDDGGYDHGIAFLIDAATGDIVRTIHNPTSGGTNHFGYSVAALGSNLLIGSFCDNTGAYQAGAVHLVNAATGALMRTFANPTPASGERFGVSVAALGNNVLVGCYMDGGEASESGAAYLLDGTTGNVLLRIPNPTPAVGDHFGISVAAVGSNILVSAYHDDLGAIDSGCAYLFDGTTGALLHTLPNPIPAASDWFGIAVAGVGNDCLVGALYDDTGATNAGAAYLFDGETGDLLHTFLNPSPAADDGFGIGLGAIGLDILVGAYKDDTGAGDTGIAYRFEGVPEPATLALLAAGALALLRRRGGRAA